MAAMGRGTAGEAMKEKLITRRWLRPRFSLWAMLVLSTVAN